MTDGDSKPAPACDAGPNAMGTRRKFAIVRVMLAVQNATVGLAFCFMFFSTSLSCTASCGMGSAICLIQSVNSCLLVVALVVERKWALLVLPVASWLLVCLLVVTSVH